MAVQSGGYDWNSAGETEIGWISVLTPARVVGANGSTLTMDVWWKFTPSVTGTLAFSTEFSKSVDASEPDTDARLYSGPSDAMKILEFAESGYERASVSSLTARFAYSVTAGVEYHIKVSGSNITLAAIAIAPVTVGEWLRDPPKTIATAIKSEDAGAGMPAALGMTWHAEHTTHRNPDSNTPSSMRSNAEGEWSLLPAPTLVTASGPGRGFSVSAQIRCVYDLGGYTDSSAQTNGTSAGFYFTRHAIGGGWGKADYDMPDGTYGYETEDPDYSYAGTRVRLKVEWGIVGPPSPSESPTAIYSVGLRVGPVAGIGIGRLVDTKMFSGGNPPAGSYRTVEFDLAPGDYANADQICYLMPQPIVKTGTWYAALSTNGRDADAEPSVLWTGFSSDGYPERLDTFVPPRYRYYYMGALEGPPRGEIDGAQVLDNAVFTPHGTGG